MKCSGANILINVLCEQGIDTIFGYPGGTVLHIYDALYQNADRIHHIITAHEQGAAHAADGYARATGKVGVVLATSGPGATNLVTGIANAYLDSVPLVAITGNVPTAMIGRDTFQEVDIFSVTMPITKHNYIVEKVEDLADILRDAFRVAKSGRPGPVLVDIPKDVQIAETDFEYQAAPVEKDRTPLFFRDKLNEAATLLTECKRPYLYCGGGILCSDAYNEVIALADRIDGVMGQSMMGLSAVPSGHPRSLGMTGMHGQYASTAAMYESDLIIALGVRFSDRATGNKEKYVKDKKILHIDIDLAEINKNIAADVGITGNVKEVLEALLEMLPDQKRPQWQARICELRQYQEEHQPTFLPGLNPYQIIDAVSDRLEPGMPVATDVGQHQLWTSQRIRLAAPRTYITSGGLGTMGFGMGAAIGACVASGKHTTLITGDGSFGMNLNELTTAVTNNLPLTIIVVNNGALGNVRQWQRMFFEERYAQTTLNRKTDFVALAEAFGAKGLRAQTPEEFTAALDAAFASSSPVLIDAHIDIDDSVYPMIPPNGSIENLILK